MATKMTPLHDRILVRRVEEAETARGGIIIPDTAKEKPQEGVVIAVGKGKSNDKGETFRLAVKEGDRILFGKYAGTEIRIDYEDLLLMREAAVVGSMGGAAKAAEKCVFFSSRRRHTRLSCDWSSDVCSSDLMIRHTRLSCDWSSDVCSSD